ncbi:glycosyltransferase family 2 protein [Sphingobium sp. EM0848]|uniref:glycosyltransferase family 2 protein n=1 Tax=Sphingobium sp. EM0848 TaxID=2743473 RepID=UPI00159C6031|nr:glycosyltransferase family 2 protein [Sphingobium sp. EM0848]
MPSAASFIDRSLARKFLPDPVARPEFAVVIPTLNEAPNIPVIIAALDRTLAQFDYELIFVDDWSSDGTRETIAREAEARADTGPTIRVLSRYGRKGLSSAVIEGALSTFAPMIVVMDADMQHDERLLPDMVHALLSDQADIVIGSRYCANGSTGDWNIDRQRASRFATGIANQLLDIPISDPMSGFFAFRRRHLEQMVPRLSQLGFKVLLDILLSSDRGTRVIELPYHFRNRNAGESKLGFRVLFDFLLMVVNKRLERLLPPRLLLFGLVGLLGLAVHLATLSAGLSILKLPFGAAQTLAVGVAIGFNFLLNNAITYRDRRLKGWRMIQGMASFYAICGLGALANVGVGMLAFAERPNWWLAGIAGAVVGAAWNFLASRWLTWRDK